MKVTAERVTDTGVYDGKEWFNFSRFGDRPSIEPGKTYDIEYKDFKGKKYIQKASQLGGNASSAPTPTPAVAVSSADFESRKNKRILVQGVLQAAIQSPGLVGFAATADEYLTAVETATKREVAFIESLI